MGTAGDDRSSAEGVTRAAFHAASLDGSERTSPSLASPPLGVSSRRCTIGSTGDDETAGPLFSVTTAVRAPSARDQVQGLAGKELARLLSTTGRVMLCSLHPPPTAVFAFRFCILDASTFLASEQQGDADGSDGDPNDSLLTVPAGIITIIVIKRDRSSLSAVLPRLVSFGATRDPHD
ncbi:hypothetical protein MRX96_007551 [Rhipicephalus microplus]